MMRLTKATMAMWVGLSAGAMGAAGCKNAASGVEAAAAEADVSSARVALDNIGRQIDMHWVKKRERPESLQVLVDAGQLTAAQLTDPWSHALRYSAEAAHYEVCSNGPDGAAKTGDDICKSGDR